MKKVVFVVLVITLFSGCIGEYTGKFSKKPKIIHEDGSIAVYFCPQEGCREAMVEILKGGEESVHCAFFDLDLEEVKDVFERELDLKIVMDVGNKEHLNGLNPVVNEGNQLMHNKFCVVDGRKVVTGSFNPTERGNFYNNNNMVVIESEHIARNYEEEFAELYSGVFSGGEGVKYPIVYLGDLKVENYFCPEDGCSEKVIDVLENSDEEIYFMTFSFTDNNIGDVLIEKSVSGFVVKGLFEKTRVSEYSEYKRFVENDMDVKLDKNKYNLHHKVFIIDNSTVITGSYNPTKSGDERNDENVLIIDDEIIAEVFLEEFDRLWGGDEEVACGDVDDVVICEIYYNCEGRDKEEEYVGMCNPTEESVDLDYYFLTRKDYNQRLNGYLSPNQKKRFHVDFSLPNSGGEVSLYKGGERKDHVAWGEAWGLESAKGGLLLRKSFNRSSCQEEWETSERSLNG